MTPVVNELPMSTPDSGSDSRGTSGDLVGREVSRLRDNPSGAVGSGGGIASVARKTSELSEASLIPTHSHRTRPHPHALGTRRIRPPDRGAPTPLELAFKAVEPVEPVAAPLLRGISSQRRRLQILKQVDKVPQDRRAEVVTITASLLGQRWHPSNSAVRSEILEMIIALEDEAAEAAKLVSALAGREAHDTTKLEILRTISDMEQTERSEFLTVALPLLEGVTDSHTRLTMINALISIPADERLGVVKIAERAAGGNPHTQHAILVTVAALKEGEELIQDALPLLEGVTDRSVLSNILLAVHHLPKDERARVIEDAKPLLAGGTNGAALSAILRSLARLSAEGRAALISAATPHLKGVVAGAARIEILRFGKQRVQSEEPTRPEKVKTAEMDGSPVVLPTEWLEIFEFESEELKGRVRDDLTLVIQNEKSRELLERLITPFLGKRKISIHQGPVWHADVTDPKKGCSITYNYGTEDRSVCLDESTKLVIGDIASYIAFVHELIHILHFHEERVGGEWDVSHLDRGYRLLFSNPEERATIGETEAIPWFSDDLLIPDGGLTENEFRKSLGLRQRLGHKGIVGQRKDAVSAFTLSIASRTPLWDRATLLSGYQTLLSQDTSEDDTSEDPEPCTEEFCQLVQLAMIGGNWELCEICFTRSKEFLVGLMGPEGTSSPEALALEVVGYADAPFIANLLQHLDQYLRDSATFGPIESFATRLIGTLRIARA